MNYFPILAYLLFSSEEIKSWPSPDFLHLSTNTTLVTVLSICWDLESAEKKGQEEEFYCS